jgi:hypothetical protein
MTARDTAWMDWVSDCEPGEKRARRYGFQDSSGRDAERGFRAGYAAAKAEALSEPGRCMASNDDGEQCIYGANHLIAHHRFPSEVEATIIDEIAPAGRGPA